MGQQENGAGAVSLEEKSEQIALYAVYEDHQEQHLEMSVVDFFTNKKSAVVCFNHKKDQLIYSEEYKVDDGFDAKDVTDSDNAILFISNSGAEMFLRIDTLTVDDVKSDSYPTVCISLGSLYNSGHRCLYFGGTIVKTTVGGKENYKLHKDDSEQQIILYDECNLVVLQSVGDDVLVENPETNWRILFTKEEFCIAAAGAEIEVPRLQYDGKGGY